MKELLQFFIQGLVNIFYSIVSLALYITGFSGIYTSLSQTGIKAIIVFLGAIIFIALVIVVTLVLGSILNEYYKKK